MVKRYKFTSTAFAGSMSFAYENGQIKEALFDCDLNEAQEHYVRMEFPYREELLANMKGKHGTIKEVQADLSFKSFWDAYAVKINRKRVEPLWERLAKAERVAVFEAIPRHRFYTKSKGISMPNPENFLRDRRWEDEFEMKK